MEFMKVVKNKNISLQAKGLMAIMIMLGSEDDDKEEYGLVDLTECLKETETEEGRKFVKAALKELAEAGALAIKE